MIRLAVAAFLAASPAAASTCVLNALDVSSSVDHPEWELMRDGIADALTDPRIVDAAASDEVWVAFFLWSRNQSVAVDWTRVASLRDLDAVAARVRATSRGRLIDSHNTAVAEALRFGGEMLRSGPQCDRLVLDVVSDGINDNGSTGLTVAEVIDSFGYSIDVNVLSIGEGNDDYWRQEVATGFTMHIGGFDEFPAAIRRKLSLEIAGSSAAGRRL